MMMIEVILALPQQAYRQSWQVEDPITAREAVLEAEARGLPLEPYGLDAATVPIGIFSEKVPDDQLLRPGERVEIYRPLEQDPKERRRREARREKAGS